MSTYIAENVKELVVTTPVESATPPSELNDSDREIKRVFKNQFAIATKTANYTLLSSDHIILANGTFDITLPTASDVAGSGYKKQYTIINIGTGIATIVGTVDGVSNPTLTAQYSSITIETDGTNYYSHNTLSKTGGNLTGTLNEAEGAAIASATTTEIWSTDGNTVHITGTTTITSLGTALQAGCWKKLIFDDALILTNGANLILQGGANITTAAGNIAFVYADTTTQHRVLVFSAAAVDADEKVKVSADDTTAGYLNGKLTASDCITLTEGSGGGNETLSIKVTDATIAQGKLKSTTGEVSLFNTGNVITQVSTTLPGGEYQLGLKWKTDSGTADEVEAYAIPCKSITVGTLTSVYVAQILLYYDRTGSGSNDGSLQVQQRYIQASPPYEPYRKNDVVPLFVFGLMDKASGKIIATYVAPDPPWANNGPTIINPLGLVQRIKKQKSGVNLTDLKTGKTKPKDFGFLLENFEEPTKEEIKTISAMPVTQEEKNADMAEIPHPFASFNPKTQTIIVLSPTDEKFCNGLARLHELGESVSEIIHGDHITIDNTPMEGIVTPESVMAVNAKWK